MTAGTPAPVRSVLSAEKGEITPGSPAWLVQVSAPAAAIWAPGTMASGTVTSRVITACSPSGKLAQLATSWLPTMEAAASGASPFTAEIEGFTKAAGRSTARATSKAPLDSAPWATVTSTSTVSPASAAPPWEATERVSRGSSTRIGGVLSLSCWAAPSRVQSKVAALRSSTPPLASALLATTVTTSNVIVSPSASSAALVTSPRSIVTSRPPRATTGAGAPLEKARPASALTAPTLTTARPEGRLSVITAPGVRPSGTVTCTR